MFAGPVSILLIASRFTVEQQGFYYTFFSLLAMQIFFELGLSTVLIQFSSHEFVNLSWGENGTIAGSENERTRFLSLVRKSLFFYLASAFLIIIVLIPVGFHFFYGNGKYAHALFSWRAPWVLAVVGVAINLILTPIYSSIVGSGEVAEVNKRQLYGGIIGNFLMWSVIAIGGGLFAIFAYSLGNILSLLFYFITKKRSFLSAIWENTGIRVDTNGISWWKDLWPMQWKIALSWMSGYFIFQLFNPILFHYHGSVVAGKMGMTLNVANAMLAVCMSWINSRNPEMGKYIARKEWMRLDKVFNKIFLQSSILAVIGSTVGWIILVILQRHYKIGARFIPATFAFCVFITMGIQVAIASFATYLRAHKREPFLMFSISMAILQGFSTWYFGMKYSYSGIVLSFLTINGAIALPSAYLIWKYCRKKWHVQ
jgi:hypothetical protein